MPAASMSLESKLTLNSFTPFQSQPSVPLPKNATPTNSVASQMAVSSFNRSGYLTSVSFVMEMVD